MVVVEAGESPSKRKLLQIARPVVAHASDTPIYRCLMSLATILDLEGFQRTVRIPQGNPGALRGPEMQEILISQRPIS